MAKDINNPINLTNVFSIKDYAINTVAPKYFNLENVNDVNVGLIGYTTDLIANTTEDSFNVTTTFINEMFPNLAILPETIYSNAALFKIDNLFATASELSTMVFISEKDLIENATFKDNLGTFYLDSAMVIDVEGKQFSPDYDIKIVIRPFRGDFIFSVMYDKTFDNSISKIVNPYIKSMRVMLKNQKYLAFSIDVHQINKFTITDNLINNDKINIQSVYFQFNGQIANFDVFYRESPSDKWIQLTKLLTGSSPLKLPFCFYKLITENKIELSFTSRDGYFQPAFNSEIMIQYYETKGADGNFKEYTGTDINIFVESEKYPYNNHLIMFAYPQTGAYFGKDKLTLEELRRMVIEKFSTVESYTTENDLELYFSNFDTKENGNIKFIKKRDDVFMRLFAAFSVYKDMRGDIYKTNTLHLELNHSKFNTYYPQDKTYIYKPGQLLTYKGDAKDVVVQMAEGETADFIFTNPYLMIYTMDPSFVGYYLNTVDETVPLDYTYINEDSISQFICNNIFIKRNAIVGEDEYVITTKITPASDLENPILDEETGLETGNLKLKLMISNERNEICYFDMNFKSMDEKTKIYTYEARIKTDDYFITSNYFKVLNGKQIRLPERKEENEEIMKLVEEEDSVNINIPFMVPMFDARVSICTFYKNKDVNYYHKYDSIEDVADLTLTNIYMTETHRTDFIYPINIMQSQSRFLDVGNSNYDILIYTVPLIAHEITKSSEDVYYLIKQIQAQYDYINEIIHQIINNYSIDMKFYNTYGVSNNFVIEEGSEILDKVNLKIYFKFSLVFGTDVETFTRDVKIYIKNHIESINASGESSFYVSKLIQELENTFAEIKYLKFVRINNYDSSIQVIDNKTTDLSLLSKEDRMYYVPEYLNIGLDDINVEIL